MWRPWRHSRQAPQETSAGGVKQNWQQPAGYLEGPSILVVMGSSLGRQSHLLLSGTDSGDRTGLSQCVLCPEWQACNWRLFLASHPYLPEAVTVLSCTLPFLFPQRGLCLYALLLSWEKEELVPTCPAASAFPGRQVALQCISRGQRLFGLGEPLNYVPLCLLLRLLSVPG